MNKYNTAAGLRMALEERLKNDSKKFSIQIARLRRQVVFDRFLARLFSGKLNNIILKGGYVFELRLKHARTTKDIDFSFTGDVWFRRNSNNKNPSY